MCSPSTLIASSAKAGEVLDWNSEHDKLEEIIESGWKWHKKHPHGYAK